MFLLSVWDISKAQITLSITIPNPLPEYNGTYEHFGQHHLFYPNEGEVRYADEARNSAIDEVAFYTHYVWPRQYLLTNNNISFVFSKHDTATSNPADSLHRIDVEMDRGRASAFLARVDTQNTCVLNYFTEWFGSTGRTGVKGGAAIACQSIWPNIDMVYTSNNTGLKIYYVVYPGGDPNNIVLHIKGSKSNAIVGNDLVIDANWSSTKFVKPHMYQYTLINNVVTPYIVCQASWQSVGANRYKIDNATAYDPNLPLIVQVSQGPETQSSVNNLNWSTFFGGGDFDYIYKTRSDANNNLFIAGETVSPDFPQTATATPVQSQNFYYDAFLSKFNANGVLLWSTYLGGSGTDYIKDFAFQGGDVWCVGTSFSFNFPVQTKSGAFNDNSYAGGNGDGFIFQVDNTTGGTNSWSTYFGGDGGDEFRGCKFDGNGNFFVVGSSNSTDLTPSGPTGSYQQNYNPTQQTAPMPAPDICDGIILKLDATNSTLEWFTFYGTDAGGLHAHSNFDDQFWDIDIAGTDVYVCGIAGGTNLPGSINSKQLSGSADGILAHFTTGGVLNAGKYTDGNMVNNSVKVFNSKVYVCGLSKNGMTPVNSGSYYYDGTCAAGDLDAVFSVHSSDLNTTIHNTFLGNTGNDHAYEIQFAPNGVFYITGQTYAGSFPITSIANTYTQSHAGNADYFIAAFQEGSTNIIWSTCLGGPDYEPEPMKNECASIAIDGQGFLHLGGSSTAYNAFPLNHGLGIPYFQPVRAGGAQGFMMTDGTITRFNLTPVNVFVGLSDFKNTSFSFGLYPNPATKYLAITHAELLNRELHYALYNMVGQKILEGKLSSGETNIDISPLPNGVYLINVSNGSRTFSNKFIKSTD